MRRRTILAALATTSVTVAGCLGDETDNTAGADDDTGDTDSDGNGNNDDTATGETPEAVTGYFDGEPVRPECERESETIEVGHGDDTQEYETAETVPYPDDSEFGDSEFVEFVEQFEYAYVTHNALCGRSGSNDILSVDYDVERAETFDWHDGITVVLLLRAGGPTWGVEDDGSEWMAGLGYSGVVYAVDETGAARVDFDEAHELAEDEFELHAPDPLDDGELVAAFE